MGENQKKILEMLAAGKITVEEATRLLSLVDSGKSEAPAGEPGKAEGKPAARYFRVRVEPKQGAADTIYRVGDMHVRGKVDVRVPINLIRSGMKLATLVPTDVADKVSGALHEKGINVDVRRIKYEDIEQLIASLIDSEINVESEHETVRVYVE